MSDKQRLDVMVDIETLGTDLDAPITQIAAKVFRLDGEQVEENEFEAKSNLSYLTVEDGIISGETLKWWLSINPELLGEIVNSDSEQSPKEVIVSFHEWLLNLTKEYNVFLWGNGILFDNKILEHKMKLYGLSYPIFYRNDRDVRTIFELAQMKLGKDSDEIYVEVYDEDLVRHNAIDDVTHQINLVQYCAQHLV